MLQTSAATTQSANRLMIPRNKSELHRDPVSQSLPYEQALTFNLEDDVYYDLNEFSFTIQNLIKNLSGRCNRFLQRYIEPEFLAPEGRSR